MHLTRRATLGLMSGSALALAGRPSWSRSAPARPLAVPKLDAGVMRDGARQYDLALGQGTGRFLDAKQTPVYQINGGYPGPTLKMRDGERVRINVRNAIGRDSTLHWHGMHLPAAADGGPHQIVAEGASWHPEFEVRQNAATLWYHSHMLHETGFQVYHGLAGVIIIEDAHGNRLDLPRDYGVDDIPLVLQDRRFNPDGSLQYLSTMHDVMAGMSGDTLLVNGTINPYFDATTDSLRLRLLNGSNARFYQLAFDDGRRFHQIASDGGFLEAPHQTGSITLAPAERAEIIVDLSDGAPVSLVSAPAAQGGMMADNTAFNVLQIRPDAGRRAALALPDRLVELPVPDAAAAAGARKFVLNMGMGPGRRMGSGGGMSINGQSMDMNRIDEVVKAGTSEIWTIENPSMLAHPFHIHDVQFRILDRNGIRPAPGEAGLKDTVVVPSGGRARVLLEFRDYTDPELPYMYHCHILEHEDAGMMGQFTVTA